MSHNTPTTRSYLGKKVIVFLYFLFQRAKVTYFLSNLQVSLAMSAISRKV